MKIILNQNVPNLGSLGDEVQVKDGYARNYLLPRGLAIPASGRNARAIQHRRLFLEKQRGEAIGQARGEAERVTALEVVLKARAGTGGRMFGSVTNRDLQAAMAALGVELDRKSITLHTPVKTLGTFAATVRLHTDVKVEIEFRVEPSEIVEMPPGEGGAPAAGAPPAADEAAAGAQGEAAEQATVDEAAVAAPQDAVHPSGSDTSATPEDGAGEDRAGEGSPSTPEA
jgi:large subunit ribosomal protein L9